ncbi:SMP-30/gluconolactonase/LRE family protein [Streptomyces sp. V1I1]|uniref:SMP-30/gluconolactonase/LRE family protein n=1 Tax=Streptomyces sp. V1I1 TaxID=3042272 RepID=UPI00278633FA|nr:SMP-30/gluconolactonase/LRE family protein [Streptomyces sp. V1I1]MDQ0938554.1 sugar lactone lactonase YvrE [Streptomyces sp. V1I1]
MPPLRILRIGGSGPEDVVVDAAGRVLTGTADGRILRITLPGPRTDGSVEAVAQTGGRPLGLEAPPDGRILVCDAQRGLLRLTPAPDTGVEVLVDSVDGAPLRFCSNAAAAADGTVYFTTSSSRHGLSDWRADIVEHSPTGQLLRLVPNGGTEVLLEGLQFANGVVLSADESYVAVAETGAYRLTRLWLTGPHTGRRDVLIDELPGFPDNLSRGPSGTIWIALASPREAALDWLHRRPLAWRHLAARATTRLRLPPRRIAQVLGIDQQGHALYDLQRRSTEYRMITSVYEHHQTLILGSLLEDALATCPIPPCLRTGSP